MREALCTHIFLKQAVLGQKFTIKGNGEQSRNFVYIDDLVDGCVKAMTYLTDFSKGTNEIFNLVGRNSETIHSLARICYSTVNGVMPVDIIPYCEYLPWREDDVITEDISIAKAQEKLGWTPNTNLYDGMKAIIKEWVNDGTITVSVKPHE